MLVCVQLVSAFVADSFQGQRLHCLTLVSLPAVPVSGTLLLLPRPSVPPLDTAFPYPLLHAGPVSATLLLHGLPISSSKDGSICVWDASAPNTPLVVLDVGAPVQALELQEDKGHLLCASNNLGVYDMNTTQLLYHLQAPVVPNRLSSSSNSSSSSLAGTANASPATAAEAGDVLQNNEDDDADAVDGVLLQEVWLDDDSDSDEEDNDAAVAGGAAGQPAGSQASRDTKPFTSVSCYGNLVAAGGSHIVCLDLGGGSLLRCRSHIVTMVTFTSCMWSCDCYPLATSQGALLHAKQISRCSKTSTLLLRPLFTYVLQVVLAVLFSGTCAHRMQ